LDDFPVPLLTERGDYMTQAARIKNDPDPMRDEYHIETLIARVRERAVTEGDQPEVIVTIYRAMIEAHIACGHRELARLQAGI
jgi:isochorismate pyruvate lyase